MPSPQPIWYKEILNYLVSKQTFSVKSSPYTPGTVLAVCGVSKIKDRVGEGVVTECFLFYERYMHVM